MDFFFESFVTDNIYNFRVILKTPHKVAQYPTIIWNLDWSDPLQAEA